MTPEQLANLQARASRPRRTVPVVLDGDLAQRIEALLDEIEELSAPTDGGDKRLGTKAKAPTPRLAEAKSELDALYQQAEGSTLFIVLEGLQGTVWRAMIPQYKVPKDDETRSPWGPEGVDRIAMEEPLIRACVIGHRATHDADEILPLPAETLDWLLDFATTSQKETLFLAGWVCSRADDAVPLRRTRSQTPSSASA